jgi:lysine-specific histone demethylase 1B
MDRREVIRQLMLGVPASVLLPSLLQSCEKDLVPGDIKFQGKVIVIGAGAAGVYATHLLMHYGIEVELLEASAKTGGRIQANTTFSDIAIETGAEEIHGNRSVLYDLAKHFASARLFKDDGTDFYWLNNQLRTEKYLREAADLLGEGETMFQILDSLGTYPGIDQTVTEYLTAFPLDNRFYTIANALVGNEYGANNDLIGMLALREAESLYSSGSKSFKFRTGTYWQLFESAFGGAIAKAKLSKIVASINYENSAIEVTTTNGEVFTADKVIVTVPLSMLKQSSIVFSPTLPSSKIVAIEKIGMGQGLKIFLKFTGEFWAAETSSIIGGGTIPEYWVTHYGKGSNEFLLTAFVMGTKADELALLSDSVLSSLLIAELTSIYPSGGIAAKYSGQILVKNWKNEPFIGGAYSYPSVGASGQRELLAESINAKVYFAGEATNINGHIATVHGAMESGYSAVNEILAST